MKHVYEVTLHTRGSSLVWDSWHVITTSLKDALKRAETDLAKRKTRGDESLEIGSINRVAFDVR